MYVCIYVYRYMHITLDLCLVVEASSSARRSVVRTGEGYQAVGLWGFYNSTKVRKGAGWCHHPEPCACAAESLRWALGRPCGLTVFPMKVLGSLSRLLSRGHRCRDIGIDSDMAVSITWGSFKRGLGLL